MSVLGLYLATFSGIISELQPWPTYLLQSVIEAQQQPWPSPELGVLSSIDIQCLQLANAGSEVSPCPVRLITEIPMNILVTCSVLEVHASGYAPNFLRTYLVQKEARRAPRLREVILGAIPCGPAYFRWEIAWVLVVSSYAHTDVGGSGSLTKSVIPFSLLPQAKLPNANSVLLMGHHSRLGFVILGVLATWPHFSMVQITELTSKDISFQLASMLSVDRLLLQRYNSFPTFGVRLLNNILLHDQLVSWFIGHITQCGFGLIQWKIAWSRQWECSEIATSLNLDAVYTSFLCMIIQITILAMVLMVRLNMLTLLTCLRILISSTVDLHPWFGSVMDTDVKHNPFLQDVSEPVVTEFQQLNLLYYYHASKFCPVVLLELQRSTYNLFASGTCQVRKIPSYKKFSNSGHYQEEIYFSVGHLSYPVVKQHNIPDASHSSGEEHALEPFLKLECGDISFNSSFHMCTDMRMKKSEGSGELIQWLVNNLLGAYQIWLVAWTVEVLEFSTGGGKLLFKEGGMSSESPSPTKFISATKTTTSNRHTTLA